jgi:hypothetical protein
LDLEAVHNRVVVGLAVAHILAGQVVDLVLVGVDMVVAAALQNFQYLGLISLPKNHRTRNHFIVYKCFLR